MKQTYFLIWLAGGGLVTLVTLICLSLLKFSQGRENAKDDKVWQLLFIRANHNTGFKSESCSR